MKKTLLDSVQKGFTLIELIIAIAISALLSVYAQNLIARQSEEVLASSSATYLSTVANATSQMVLYNWNNYSNGLPIPGVADPTGHAPTIAELAAPIVGPPAKPGYLNSGFPLNMPTRQSATIQVIPSNCPGSNCRLDVRVCTTTPITLGGTAARLDLASTMMTEQKGGGAQVVNIPTLGLRLTGPTLDIPAPPGFVEGIVCGLGNVDTALYNSFVKINDSRDPNFQGPLTVAGQTTLNGATSVNNNLTVLGTSTLNGAVTANNTLGVAGASTFSGATAVNNTLNVTGAFTGQTAALTGKLSADRLVPVGVYASGTACAVADAGAIANKSGATGLVVCQGGTWRDLSVTAAAGDACAVEGTTATNAAGKLMVCTNAAYRTIDSMIAGAVAGAACPTQGAFGIDTANGNASLICRVNPILGGSGHWMRLADITSNLSFVSSTQVTFDGQLVPQPTCTPSTVSPIPLIQLIPKDFSSNDAGFAFYADPPAAGSWVTHMKNSTGSLTNTVAIAQVYCYYP